MPVVINGHHRLRAKDNNIFLQLPERKIALQGMLNRARASYQQEGEARTVLYTPVSRLNKHNLGT